MKNGKFEVGDLIRGRENNGYVCTNANMHLAKVVSVNRGANVMVVRILEHENRYSIGEVFSNLYNSLDCFILMQSKDSLEASNVYKAERKIEVICNPEKRAVVALLKAGKKVLARGLAKCDPDDEFNPTLGYQLATGRLFEQMAKKDIKL